MAFSRTTVLISARAVTAESRSLLPPLSLGVSPRRTGDPLLSRCFITMPPLPELLGVGGVPLLDPVPFEDETRVGVKAPEPAFAETGLGARSQINNLPYHFLRRSLSSLSSRLLSYAERYRSYESRKFLSMREENISSPRGLAAGGMGGMGRMVDVERGRLFDEGEGERVWFDDSTGRGKKKDSGFQ